MLTLPKDGVPEEIIAQTTEDSRLEQSIEGAVPENLNGPSVPIVDAITSSALVDLDGDQDIADLCLARSKFGNGQLRSVEAEDTVLESYSGSLV